MKSIMRFLDAVEAEQATINMPSSSPNSAIANQHRKVALLSLVLVNRGLVNFFFKFC